MTGLGGAPEGTDGRLRLADRDEVVALLMRSTQHRGRDQGDLSGDGYARRSRPDSTPHGQRRRRAAGPGPVFGATQPGGLSTSLTPFKFPGRGRQPGAPGASREGCVVAQAVLLTRAVQDTPAGWPCPSSSPGRWPFLLQPGCLHSGRAAGVEWCVLTRAVPPALPCPLPSASDLTTPLTLWRHREAFFPSCLKKKTTRCFGNRDMDAIGNEPEVFLGHIISCFCHRL